MHNLLIQKHIHSEKCFSFMVAYYIIIFVHIFALLKPPKKKIRTLKPRTLKSAIFHRFHSFCSKLHTKNIIAHSFCCWILSQDLKQWDPFIRLSRCAPIPRSVPCGKSQCYIITVSVMSEATGDNMFYTRYRHEYHSHFVLVTIIVIWQLVKLHILLFYIPLFGSSAACDMILSLPLDIQYETIC